MTSFSPLMPLLFVLTVLSGFDGATIERLEVPLAVRNGSGPVDLVCVYNVPETENGLVIKWYLNGEQIYVWIPPMEPQDLGVIAGFASYTSETTSRPQSHSIIRLSEVNLSMSGNYVCSVSTFVSEDVSRARMTVYVREKVLNLRTFDFNETHLNVVCSATEARPRPVLVMLVDSKVLKNPLILEDYPIRAAISLSKIIEKPTKAALLGCEIHIPGTGYGYREIRTYWPLTGEQRESAKALRQTSTAPSYRADYSFGSIGLLCSSIWICCSIFHGVTTSPEMKHLR